MVENQDKKHLFYMNKALAQARCALKRGEVPVGAVLVDFEGVILSRKYNKTEEKQSQAAHAECLAITQACKKRKSWRLDGCWLYVTLEPCLMCFGLITLSRISGVVYGASSPLFGASRSVGPLEKDPLRMENRLTVIGGLKEYESAAILKLFFKQARQMKKGDT